MALWKRGKLVIWKKCAKYYPNLEFQMMISVTSTELGIPDGLVVQCWRLNSTLSIQHQPWQNTIAAIATQTTQVRAQASSRMWRRRHFSQKSSDSSCFQTKFSSSVLDAGKSQFSIIYHSTLALINIKSLRNFEDLTAFASSFHPFILTICESWLHDDIRDIDISLPGYEFSKRSNGWKAWWRYLCFY